MAIQSVLVAAPAYFTAASGRLPRDAALAFALVGDFAAERHEFVEPALERTRATVLVAAVPEPCTAAWMSNYGEPLVRFCTVPILFVPEPRKGASR